MVEPKDATSDSANKEKTAVVKIDPVKIEVTSSGVELSESNDKQVDDKIEVESR